MQPLPQQLHSSKLLGLVNPIKASGYHAADENGGSEENGFMRNNVNSELSHVPDAQVGDSMALGFKLENIGNEHPT